MEIDLEEDNPLLGLREKADQSATAVDVAADWRILNGVPDAGYKVIKGYSFSSMSLWKVRFIGKCSKPSWTHGKVSRAWVTYEMTECLWKGPDAQETGQYVRKDGKVVSVFVSAIEGFEMTLMDAVCRMEEYRDYYIQTAQNHVPVIQAEIEAKKVQLEERLRYIKTLQAFKPKEVVPSDILDEEELEEERAMDRILANALALDPENAKGSVAVPVPFSG
jgi:hypothetical protein